MKVQKKIIGELEKCYSLAMLKYHNKNHFLIAAEKVNKCYLYDLKGNREETVWEKPGGVMTMVQVPGTDGQFLATQKFYSPNDSKEASIVIVTPHTKNNWEIRTLVDLPFVHRFDIVTSGNINYLLACTLKSKHEYKEDWRFPGKVFAAILPNDLTEFNSEHQLKLTVLKDNMLKNHGYYRHYDDNNRTSGIISCDSGVYQFLPPFGSYDKWCIKQLTNDAASDALLLDLNNDGHEELCTISPFHGNEIKIYQKKNNNFILDYVYPQKLEFLHAIWGGKVLGKSMLIIGHRKGERCLLAITYETGKGYKSQILDKNSGAANILHYICEDKDIIIGANREINEIASYELTN